VGLVVVVDMPEYPRKMYQDLERVGQRSAPPGHLIRLSENQM
jgi:hypothetical protein